jgi:hypothetical protein
MVAHKAVGAWDWGPLLAARRMWSDLGLDTTLDQLARPDRREDQYMDWAAGGADDRESTAPPGEPMKRFTIDVPVSLHRRVKAACPSAG